MGRRDMKTTMWLRDDRLGMPLMDYEWTMNVEYDAYIRRISNPKYDRALKAIVPIYRDFYLTFLYQYQ